MSNPIRFIMKANANVSQFSFRLESQKTPLPMSYPSIGVAMEAIAEIVPLDQQIVFRHHNSECDSFLPMTVEGWLRATYRARSVRKEDKEAEIEAIRLNAVNTMDEAGEWA